MKPLKLTFDIDEDMVREMIESEIEEVIDNEVHREVNAYIKAHKGAIGIKVDKTSIKKAVNRTIDEVIADSYELIEEKINKAVEKTMDEMIHKKIEQLIKAGLVCETDAQNRAKYGIFG